MDGDSFLPLVVSLLGGAAVGVEREWSGHAQGENARFAGVRTFTLSPAGSGATSFTMREEYSGPLLPLIWRSMPDLQPSFDQFARGLKARAEGAGSDG